MMHIHLLIALLLTGYSALIFAAPRSGNRPDRFGGGEGGRGDKHHQKRAAAVEDNEPTKVAKRGAANPSQDIQLCISGMPAGFNIGDGIGRCEDMSISRSSPSPTPAPSLPPTSLPGHSPIPTWMPSSSPKQSPSPVWSPSPSPDASQSSVPSSTGGTTNSGGHGHTGPSGNPNWNNGYGTPPAGVDLIGSDVCGNGGCQSQQQYCAQIAMYGHHDPVCGGSAAASASAGLGGGAYANSSSSSGAYANSSSSTGGSGSGNGKWNNGFGTPPTNGAVDTIGSDVCGNGGCQSQEQYCEAVRRYGHHDPKCEGGGGAAATAGAGGSGDGASAGGASAVASAFASAGAGYSDGSVNGGYSTTSNPSGSTPCSSASSASSTVSVIYVG